MSSTSADSLPRTIVIFGASGDVTCRKFIPALFGLTQKGHMAQPFVVVGYGRSPKSDEQFRAEMHQGVRKYSESVWDEDAWRGFASSLYYVAGDYDSPKGLASLRKRLDEINGSGNNGPVLYYLALPPSVAEQVLRTMAQTDAASRDGARIMLEKPFGLDLASAQRMNAILAPLFPEERIYRVDHFLAKDTVRSLTYFRFANTIFEPLWNRNYIDNVQITAAEDIGIEGRGGYYEEAGVVRDMLQNHVLQVVALVAMEPPLAQDVESFRFRMVEVFKSISSLREGDFVLGQYDGYRAEANVSPTSTTPTFAAARLCIENWRWQGVPFYVRSGKALARKVTEVVIQFKRLPFCILEQCHSTCVAPPNVLFIRIQPEEGMTLQFNIRRPGHEDSLEPVRLDFRYTSLASRPAAAYESVILNALQGRPALFWRCDGIEAAWQVVAPLLARSGSPPGGYPNYAQSSWGPAAADELLRRDGRQWRSLYETV
jgi:glucose-6-phosphate 1-dehydrogenase